jgi:NAD(P)-dependent dehydrogenase (short-subunit alcohol dehydrogenase family)
VGASARVFTSGGASKAAVMGLTIDLAQPWGSRRGIRVNAIAPGFFESEMTNQYQAGPLDSFAPRILLQRLGDPQEFAATAVWLASDAAATPRVKPSSWMAASPSREYAASNSAGLRLRPAGMTTSPRRYGCSERVRTESPPGEEDRE